MSAQTITIHLSARSVVLTLGILALAAAALRIPDVLVMILVAAILASGLYPGVRWLQTRWNWSRPLAIAGMFGAVVGVLLTLTMALVPTLAEQSQQLAQNFPVYMKNVRASYAWLQGFDARYRLLPDMDSAIHTLSANAGTWLTSTLGWATRLLGGFATFAVVMMLTCFILLDGPDFKRGLLALAPPAHRPTLEAQFEPVALKLGGYVQGVLTSIAFLSAYLALALTLAGVPFSLALALLAGAFELIPLVGSLLGAIPAVLVALTVGWKTAAAVVMIFAVGNLIQGNVVAPIVFSRAVALSPGMVFLALLVGANLFGFAGALIAVPLLAMVQVLVQNLYIEPMERAWADRLQLEPVPLSGVDGHEATAQPGQPAPSPEG
ncbi:MAG: AI-2E family transporter [Candidatus Sericytochromatia bacterium]|nr:AI-2E family transporter [Candidatus Sericytochromatia bacterium]